MMLVHRENINSSTSSVEHVENLMVSEGQYFSVVSNVYLCMQKRVAESQEFPVQE